MPTDPDDDRPPRSGHLPPVPGLDDSTDDSTSARSSAASAETASMSVRRLAELAGVSNPYLSQIERGLRKPSADILQQIAKALQISAETLYVRARVASERPHRQRRPRRHRPRPPAHPRATPGTHPGVRELRRRDHRRRPDLTRTDRRPACSAERES
ncbi:MAG: helix-turn-helix transcriptional regulator [Ilumatobacteraceae bacterium]